ncbi:PLDc N-terminal domain-containing protein [Croceitalea marina]|uniref:PLDc N-terminal domain-containing protein n=1 Tax=Croceitalea marina TaxID=1775166 RepID=A0ABW5N2V0_9FLAO
MNDKLIWFLVVLFIPLVGSILYIFIGRKQRLMLY